MTLLDDHKLSRRLQWANLLLSVIAVILLVAIVVQIYVASSVSTIKEAVIALQNQMKVVEAALIIKENKAANKP